jgi:spore germination protein YaaH
LLQVWFDNPESLAAKYKVASDHGLAGIGFWNLDCLDYSSSDKTVQQQTAAMWAAVKQAVAGWKQQQQQQQQPGSGSEQPATS